MQYEILEVLGRGGMGVVYKAMDTRLHRTVAIKVFHENLVQQEVVIKRFIRESSISAQLDHPNIVKVYNFEKQAGQSYLVMEFIQGKPLLDYIQEYQPGLESKLEILAKVANALHYAHRKNIIHRDIKPANIMVKPNGEPVLMDFGIAKCIGLDELTRTGEFVGTIQYVSPEQAEGKRREIDHRTDIYSLGAVMYHLLVDRPPIDAETFNEMLYQLEYQKLIPPRELHPEISPGVEQICLKALAKDKKQRYASAQEFADDIKNSLSGKKTKAVAWSKQQFWRRWLLRTAFVLGILLVILAISLVSYSYSQQQKIATKQAEFIQKVQIIQAQIEKQETWRMDNPEAWQQAYQNGKEAYDIYQQHREWINDPTLETKLPNHLTECAYKTGIHEWAEDPLQSISSFSSVLSMSLPKEKQSVKTQLAILATDMHLKYLGHHYNEVCEIFLSFQALFKETRYVFLYYPEVAFLVAKSHYHCQKYEDAQKYLQNLMQYSNFMAHKKIKSEVFYYQGMCYYHNHQYKEALKNFEDAAQARNAYNKPVDFGISLLIRWGDCQSQLIPYSESLSDQQKSLFAQIIHKLENEISKLPQQSEELALYYELHARHLLLPVDGQSPSPEKIEKALELVSKSAHILPCRYTQHILRGIAFQYQGKTNFSQYHKAWQEFNDAAQLNPHQADSVAFIIAMNSEYLNFSRDQVSDLIMQLHRWNIRMDSVATDFYASRMQQLELQCQGQLQKFVGIPYQEQLVEKFYNDLQSSVPAIRSLAQSSLIDLVSYTDGIANHHFAHTYLSQKLKQLEEGHPLRPSILGILQEIDAQAWKESSWQHLYLLVRIPYRGHIPDLLLAECNTRPGMIPFLMKMLLDHRGEMMPELKSSWLWLQYLAARVLVQLPYPLTDETLTHLAGVANSQHKYARQILYDMITSPSQNQSLSPMFCLVVAKALKDARFLWWDRTLIYDWFSKTWPQLKDHDSPEDMWLQTNLASLLISATDAKARELLAIIYQQTKYKLVKAWIVHEMPQYENSFLPNQVVLDWYRWLSKKNKQQFTEPPEETQLRLINIMNTKTICPYIIQKYRAQSSKNQEQEKKKEYVQIVDILSCLLQDNTEDVNIHKAVMSTMLISWELTKIWNIVSNTNRAFVDKMKELLTSSDQETRLLAIAAVPLMGNAISWQELAQKAVEPQQLFVEKIALFYGLSNGVSKNRDVPGFQEDLKGVLNFLMQIKEPRTLGWIFSMLCYFRYYLEDNIDDSNARMILISQIPMKMVQYLDSPSHELLFWTLVSMTRINEFNAVVYNKVSKMVMEHKFPSPMLEILGLGVLINISIKQNLKDDYRKWTSLAYTTLQNPQFRPYLSILVWSYVQATKNNDINWQLHGEIIGREEPIAIQDIQWLRYQKSLLDPRVRHNAEAGLQGSLQVFAQFSDNLTMLEQEQLQQAELMLAELYYKHGNIAQGNQILEQNNKHLKQWPIAILWAENNPQRVHEICPNWNEKNQQNAKDHKSATMHDAAIFMRMTAIQHTQEKHNEMAIQALKEATLLEPGDPQSWILLFDAMLAANQADQAIKVVQEAHHSGFYQARTYWALARYYAQCSPSNEKEGKIRQMLENAGSPWEYPITLKMLGDLHCEGMPSAALSYHLAVNHANSHWHYEACFWLKEAAQRQHKLTDWQVNNDFKVFQKYKAKKYQAWNVQAAIKQLFESKQK